MEKHEMDTDQYKMVSNGTLYVPNGYASNGYVPNGYVPNGTSIETSRIRSTFNQPQESIDEDVVDGEKPKAQHYDAGWKALAGWFLGPRAENKDVFLNIFTALFKKHSDMRRNCFPTDPSYITRSMRSSNEFESEVDDMKDVLFKMADELGKSVPFFSPRYQAHMAWDTTMPSMLGYMMAMLHAQNNVDTAASPVTTSYERAVGLQLCNMLGYSINKKDKSRPKGWGHITCGGSVANIEALWASRNIKYSAIGIRDAVESVDNEIMNAEEKKLALEYPTKVPVQVKATDGSGSITYEWEHVPLHHCTNDQLLNMDIDDYCGMTRKVAEYAGISGEQVNDTTKLDRFGAWVEKCSFTSMGALNFMLKHNLTSGYYTCPANCHYSWSKAGTLLGLGSDALVPIPLDDEFRQAIDDEDRNLDESGEWDRITLESELVRLAKAKKHVYSVTAVIGSTEESAVDNIKKINELRESMKRKYGFNFAILADAAWGGYFKTMLTDEPFKNEDTPDKNFVPWMPLSSYVQEQYRNIQMADTITIDPHKSGFCPYPSGALCYRNGEMRYFIAVFHPEVFHGPDDPTMGVYGIEGSKPGAAPTAVLASHKVIGLDAWGYGRILGQCQMTTKIFWCLWLVLSRPEDPFTCVPLQEVPKQYKYMVQCKIGGNMYQVSEAERICREEILGKSMSEINQNKYAMEFLAAVGPDTLINTFVVNMKGNKDIKKVNLLQKALSDDLNYAPKKLNNERIPIILMQSGISTAHGMALRKFKQRIGVIEEGPEIELNMMVNSCMNPWQWSESIAVLGEILRWKILNNIGKLNDQAGAHEFVVTSDMDSAGSFFAELLPDLDRNEAQYHLVAKFTLGKNEAGRAIPRGTRLMMDEVKLHDILDGKKEWNFTWVKECGHSGVFLKVVDVPRFQHIDMSPYANYSKHARYFIYGSEECNQVIMTHCINKKPDYMHVVQLDSQPHGMTWDLIHHGIEISICELQGSPRINSRGCVMNPLNNSSYDIHYRGREHAECCTTISLENSRNDIPIFSPL